jgi:hypothetical protein
MIGKQIEMSVNDRILQSVQFVEHLEMQPHPSVVVVNDPDRHCAVGVVDSQNVPGCEDVDD